MGLPHRCVRRGWHQIKKVVQPDGIELSSSPFITLTLSRPPDQRLCAAAHVLIMHDRAAHARFHPLVSTFGVLIPRSSNHRSNCELMPRNLMFECLMLALQFCKMCFDSHKVHRFVSSRAKACRTSDRGIPNSRAIRDGVMPALNADRTAFT